VAFSLNKLLKVQRLLVRAKIAFYNRFWGMHIDPTAVISLKARLDRTHPKGVYIGAQSYVALHATILTHDMVRGLRIDTRIGSHCFIGAGSLVLPGVTIGDHVIVAAGAVVTRDVPSHSIVAGNPAKVIRSDIATREYGILLPDSSTPPDVTMSATP
jgi:acetyltransferase-like isoleucine patch superfamily enzyme